MKTFKSLRTERGITQHELAMRAGVSTQAVMRYEQGLYEGLSYSIARNLAIMTDTPVDEVYKTYDLARNEQQLNADLTKVPPIRLLGDKHPFETFREDVMKSKGKNPSRIAFCILLAIHPATVAEYDSGRVKHMPALIERALDNAGLDSEYLDTLKTLGEIWYERHSA